MRKKCKTMDQVKQEVCSLVGKPIKISVNRGRNKIERYKGSVIFTYPHLFVVRIDNDEQIDRLSLSYKEVICGEVKLT